MMKHIMAITVMVTPAATCWRPAPALHSRPFNDSDDRQQWKAFAEEGGHVEN